MGKSSMQSSKGVDEDAKVRDGISRENALDLTLANAQARWTPAAACAGQKGGNAPHLTRRPHTQRQWRGSWRLRHMGVFTAVATAWPPPSCRRRLELTRARRCGSRSTGPMLSRSRRESTARLRAAPTRRTRTRRQRTAASPSTAHSTHPPTQRAAGAHLQQRLQKRLLRPRGPCDAAA